VSLVSTGTHRMILSAHGLNSSEICVHGMGYDEEHMAIVCHPGILDGRMFVHNADVYLIEAQGPSACLHRTPKEIFEII
jgi:hypothetical protein